MSRGGISYKGIHEPADFITQKANAALIAIETAGGVAVVEGMAVVKTSVDDEVGFGNAGDPIYGRVDKYEEDDYLTVQVGGFCEFPGISGALPAVGSNVVVDGSGSVSQAATGIIAGARVVNVDDTDATVVVFLG